MTQLIAVYRERRFDGKRTFELFNDRVDVSGSAQLSSDFQISIPLKTLIPTPTKLNIRHKAFWAGLWAVIGSALGCTVLGNAMNVSYASPAFILTLVLGLSGFALMLATMRKIEFIGFQSAAALRAIDIARSGPDAGKLDSFIKRMADRIAAASEVRVDADGNGHTTAV